MSMQSVLLTAALHYILCPSSLPPPLSPPAAGMLSPSPPNPISLLLSFQYNLSLLSPLRFLPSSSPSRFLMQHRHSANMWSSSSPSSPSSPPHPLTPPHPPHPSQSLACFASIHPDSVFALLFAWAGSSMWSSTPHQTSIPPSPLFSLSLVQSHRVSPSICISHPSLFSFVLFCGLSAFLRLFPLPRSRRLKTFQACLIIFLHVAGFVSVCVSAFSLSGFVLFPKCQLYSERQACTHTYRFTHITSDLVLNQSPGQEMSHTQLKAKTLAG